MTGCKSEGVDRHMHRLFDVKGQQRRSYRKRSATTLWALYEPLG